MDCFRFASNGNNQDHKDFLCPKSQTCWVTHKKHRVKTIILRRKGELHPHCVHHYLHGTQKVVDEDRLTPITHFNSHTIFRRVLLLLAPASTLINHSARKLPLTSYRYDSCTYTTHDKITAQGTTTKTKRDTEKAFFDILDGPVTEDWGSAVMDGVTLAEAGIGSVDAI